MKSYSKTYLRIELRLLLRSRAARFTLLAFFAMSIAACIVGIAAQRAQQNTLLALKRNEQDARQHALRVARAEDAGALKLGQFRDPRDPANYARIALAASVSHPPAPAFGIAAAHGSRLPFYFVANTGPESKSLTGYEYTNPEQLRAGGFDLLFVILYVLPVAFMVLGHAVWTADRMTGNHRLVALGLGRERSVYLRRLMLANSLPVLLTLFAGVVIITAADGALSLKLHAALAFVPATLLYAAFWLGVQALVIRRAPSPATSIAVMIVVFVACAVLVPSLATWFATEAHPQPARADTLNASRQNSDRVSHELPQLTTAFFRLHPEWKRDGQSIPAGAQTLITTTLIDQTNRGSEVAMENNLLQQHKFLLAWRWVSPVLLLSDEVDRLAHVDDDTHVAFLQQAREYVSRLRAFYLPILLKPEGLSASAVNQMNDYPSFHLNEPSRRVFRLTDALCWVVILSILSAGWFLQGASVPKRLRLHRKQEGASA